MGGGGELECESIFVAFACIYGNKKALDDLVVFTCLWMVSWQFGSPPCQRWVWIVFPSVHMYCGENVFSRYKNQVGRRIVRSTEYTVILPESITENLKV